MRQAPHIPNHQYALTVATSATVEPIDIDTAKTFLRVETPDDDHLIAGFIAAARQYTANKLARTLCTTTWRLALDDFPDGNSPIVLHNPPVTTTTTNVSITYIDSNGNSTTLASSNYQLDGYSEPGRIYPGYGLTWPEARSQPNAVVVQYVAGYGNSVDSVPSGIRAFMLRVIAELYENREMTVVGTISQEYPHLDGMLDPYRWSLQCG